MIYHNINTWLAVLVTFVPASSSFSGDGEVEKTRLLSDAQIRMRHTCPVQDDDENVDIRLADCRGSRVNE